MLRACGVTRFVYNWAYDRNQEHYKLTGKALSEFELRDEFNAIRREQYPWTYEVTKGAYECGVTRFRNALDFFFYGISEFPVKKKRKQDCSFSIPFSNLVINGKRLNLPHCGKLKMAETVKFSGKPKCVDIKHEGNEWYACIVVDVMPPFQYRHECENQARSVGIDLGLKDYITLSTGEKVKAPKIGRKLEKRLAQANKSLSRKVKRSCNWKKAKARVNKIHKLIARQRNHFINELTSRLVREYGFIGIENLNLKGMMKTNLAKSLADAGLGEFVRQLEYKSKLAGSIVQKIDRFYASTKTCSSCNLITGSSRLDIRAWTCTNCGAAHDRDVNAALNIEREASRKYQEVIACGDMVKPKGTRSRRYKSVKQELPSNSPSEMR